MESDHFGTQGIAAQIESTLSQPAVARARTDLSGRSSAMAIPAATFKVPNFTLCMREQLGSFPIKTRHLPSILLRRSLLIFPENVGRLGRRLPTMSRLYLQSGSNGGVLDPCTTVVQILELEKLSFGQECAGEA